jgi:hypothetical protein
MLWFRWEDLAGWTIRHIEVVDAGDRLNIRAERGDAEQVISFVAEGDCCAHAYIDENSQGELEGVSGGTIVDASERYVDDPRGCNGDHHDACFYALRTTAGDLTLTLHVEHNGYYSGRLRYDLSYSEQATDALRAYRSSPPRPAGSTI